MSENVTFERREFRATPPRGRPFRPPLLACLGQDDVSFPHKLPQIIIFLLDFVQVFISVYNCVCAFNVFALKLP